MIFFLYITFISYLCNRNQILPPMAEKDSFKEIMLLQPNNITFGQFSITPTQDNILTCIADALQKHMTKEQDIPCDLFGEPYVTINCDEAGGYNHKKRVIKEAEDLATKIFRFRWQYPNGGRPIKTSGIIITTIHDEVGTNVLRLNFNKWAIPFLIYYGKGVGGTRFNKSIALSLRGDKTKRIYKLICSQKDKTRYEYPLDKFIKEFELGPSYTPAIIKRQILEPAKKRIKESASDVWFDYELITKYKQDNGRKQKADTIVFHIKTTAAIQGSDQFRRNETIRRWVDIAFDYPTDNKTITTTDKIISSDKCDMFFNKCNYYDDQITAGKMTTQHVKNTLLKILRDEFNIR